MARRKYELPHGEGSFYRRGDGIWVGMIEAGWTEHGTRRRVTVSSKDRETAWDKLTAARKRIMTEGVAAPTTSPTVKAWADEWLTLTRDTYAPQAYEQRRSQIKRWIIPTLGRKHLDHLTPADLRKVHAAMRAEGRSASSVRSVHSAMSAMIRAAAVEGHHIPQAVLLMPPPPKGHSDRDAIPPVDAMTLMAHISTRPDASRWVAAMLQGMRQAECLGLTWDAVDLKRGLIDVSWQLVDIRYADRATRTLPELPPDREFIQLSGCRHLSRPKTTAGRRIVPLVPWMRDALERWQHAAPDNPHGLVWANGTRPWGADMDRRRWFALTDEAETWWQPGERDDAGEWIVEPDRFALHEARHTAASLLLTAGVDVEVVRQIMGHSSVAMSRAYQHADIDLMRRALDKSAELLQLPVVAPR